MRKTFFLFLGLFSLLGLAGCLPKKSSDSVDVGSPVGYEEPSPLPSEPSSSFNERPFVSLLPSLDGHWVTLELRNFPTGATSVEYELVYFAGDLGNKIERGVTGTVEIKGDALISRKILFGSESCTTGQCKYRYDENVSEGTLTLKFKSGTGIERYEAAFRIQKGEEAKESFSAGDGEFQFISSILPKNTYFLTISTFGLPSETEEKIEANPYGIFPSSSTMGTVSFKTSNSTARILFWTGQKWEELASSYLDGWVTATAQKTGVFILVR